MRDLAGQTALITGAASGMGRGVAKGIASLGATVALWDLDEQRLAPVLDEIRQGGGRAHGYACNVAERSEVSAVAERVRAAVGDIDILVNNAGVVSGELLLDLTDEEIERTFAVNTLALFWVTRAFLPAMVRRNSGHVVTLASASGYIGVARLSDYASSKWAAVGFDESLRVELRKIAPGVRTTVVCPYYVDTGMFDGVRSRFPLLMPVLREDYVVRRIVRAIRKRRRRLMLPRSLTLLPLLRTLPVDVLDAMAGVMGVNESMDHFVGRKGRGDAA